MILGTLYILFCVWFLYGLESNRVSSKDILAVCIQRALWQEVPLRAHLGDRKKLHVCGDSRRDLGSWNNADNRQPCRAELNFLPCGCLTESCPPT